MIFAQASVVLAPNLALLLYTLLFLTGVVGTSVTAAKGRWGWFLVDLVTLGLAGNLTAFLAEAPGSLWARRVRRI